MPQYGNSHASQKIKTEEAPPWTKWRTKELHSRCIRFIESQCRARKGHTFGKLLKLGEWQKEWLEEVFSGDFTASVLSLGRGNGKSTFSGAVATWALYDPAVAEEFGGQPIIPVVAPTMAQATNAVYGDALSFVRSNPELRNRALIYTANGQQKIITPFNHDGMLFPLAANPESLQGLDPMMVLVDEIGFIDLEVWDAVRLASGKRPRNLVLGLGTKSPGESDNALDHIIRQVKTHGRIDGFHLVTYEAPEGCALDDRAAWRAANPALQEGYLAESALEADLQLTREPEFRCYRLNQKVASVDGWLGMDGAGHWDATTDAARELDRSEPVYVGVDKSARGDLSAVVCLQRTPDAEAWFATARVFTPEGGAINHRAVKDYLRELHELYDLAGVGYDERYFIEGAEELHDEGLPMLQVPQTQDRMSPAYAALYQLIVTHGLWHQDDPIFRKHVLSAAAVHNSTGGFMLHKGRSRTHIDAVVALAIAVYTAGIPADIYRPENYWIA